MGISGVKGSQIVIKLTFTIVDAKLKKGEFSFFTDSNWIGVYNSPGLGDLDQYVQLVARALEATIRGKVTNINASLSFAIDQGFVNGKAFAETGSDIEERFRFVGYADIPNLGIKPHYLTLPTAPHDAFLPTTINRADLPAMGNSVPTTQLEGLSSLLDLLDVFEIFDLTTATDNRGNLLQFTSVDKIFRK